MNYKATKLVAAVFGIAVIAALVGWRLWNQGSSRPIDREHALGKLKAQAEEFRTAFLAEDFARVADLSHPKYIPQDEQNRKQFIAFRQYVATSAREQGNAVTDILLVNTSLEEAGGTVFACIEIKKEFQPTPVQGSSFQPAYWIAVSSDRGETWKFVESHMTNRAELEARFPDFPQRLQLPDRQLRVWRQDAEPGAAPDRGGR